MTAGRAALDLQRRREFGLLTLHDEYLLRMLYDPRMRPGMTVAEARAVARVIAKEIMGGES